MWWRLSILGGVTAALLFILFAPTATVSVTVDLPPGAHPASPGPMQMFVQTFILSTFWVTGGMVVLGVAGWIAWRIIRRHRNSS